ncbi:MAG: dehydrogenase [Armatimonadia bacterium]|nr:dehydrogenase [Armatimonadia bacterium]
MSSEHCIANVAPLTAELRPSERPAEPLGPTQVEGRTLVSLISPGTELNAAYRHGPFPSTQGYGAVLEVEKVGDQVEALAPGDRVFVQGLHQSWQRVDAIASRPVPPELPAEIAVFCRLMGITMSTLTTTEARPPDRVLVTGLGIVGLLGSLIFDACGYAVVACDPDPNRRELAEEKDVPTVLDRVPLEDPLLRGQIGLALECSGTEPAVADACKMVRPRGEVVLVGVPWKRTSDTQAHDLLHAIFHQYAIVRSGWEWEVPLQPAPFVRGSVYDNYAAAMGWLAQDRVDVEGLYEMTSPADCQEAYQNLLHKRGDALTYVFDWSRL